MARRAQPLSPAAGYGAALLVAALILGTLAAVALRAEPGRGLVTADWAAVRFTLLQAGLSALFSVALAVPVARALARRRFAGRSLLIALLGAPFILPVIVAILGLLAVFGRAGWVSDALGLFGLEPLSIYGLHGVVLAHVFFNLPLATRLILQGWQEIPAERFRLAAQLDAGPRAMWQLLEAPMLARVVPGALAVVFAICLSSFAVALTLGGGPRATTIELAIYQAFSFDFDLGRAALLSAVQLLLTALAAMIALRAPVGEGFGSGLDRMLRRWDGRGAMARGSDGFWILFAALFLLLPLLAVVLSGLPGVLSLPASVWQAAGASILVAGASTLILLALALPMALAAALGRPMPMEIAGLLGLAASPLVIGTGLFILIYPVASPFALALPVTALVNAVMALPFAMRILIPAARDVITRHRRLALSLDMTGRPFILWVVLPRMRAQIGFAAGLAAALSMGDLGVIALFADPEVATLPLQVYRLMGAYQMQAAAGAALVLLCLSMGAFWILDRGGRWHAEA
ncbi:MULTISPECIES: thiamine/thiamine pyrophosphate ABC transporter permease ThiP [Rhodobacterales]|jgi:thiamine transport system permease protein|uniref:thiamine/thiamine pyrophosphate ABC transporter permease ThiP n=1 Tax=Rhodobacterales TaxID=204455 RepID=UPI00237F0D81|nr:thiamine/thiamine pyrophosphate ABC transporter permease ThiP [Phaeobacter gallaeciensis]MDE4141565.1 thiamine/thiamine pyrophosphate ABC transporter permease ThiP [Phaeobacter gallaeciensis]MDE4150010.1 thiamine/thiamine pyrophosphate ABC transporter permease ThiP [Phaeobacter gallaeciensis]MDE4154236.1 thiamine/thiamine pyrophosphate ABC transporter permease ThiP [Phaeobacter gallaeciensis]MDE4229595.1 thiamine/thiamine pyrophosphate ABC transporter permease ThiP [Phaeobacter gallaeciensis